MLWLMHEFLGGLLWMHENLGTLHLLLFHGVPLPDSSSKFRRSLSEIRAIPQNCQTWTALHQPMHIVSEQSEHENQCYGSLQAEHHNKGQCFN